TQRLQLPAAFLPRIRIEYPDGPFCRVEFHAGDDLRPEPDALRRAAERLRRLPQAGGVVAATGEDRLAVRAEGHSLHAAAMLQRRSTRFATDPFPEASSAVHDACQQSTAVGTELHCPEQSLMPRRLAERRARGR